MQEVICYTCGRIVHISPDAELCSVCGENLRELLHPVYASKYFYDRAAKLAAGSQLLPALQEIDRGLRYQPSSELRLLGAILSKRIGDFEQMRYHVAAIPVDDVLRPEGEWLLRSHQIRQRELREASKSPTVSRLGAFVGGEEASSSTLEQPYPAITATTQLPPAKHRLGYGAAFALLLIVATVGAVLFAGNPSLVVFLLQKNEETARPATDLVEPVRQSIEQAAPTPTVTPDVPENVTQRIPVPTPAEVAASTPGLVVGLNAAHSFDFQAYLLQVNRDDLAQLEVSALVQGTVLSLKGIVPTFEARQALIELAESVPEATTVSAIDLLVRLPATYIVQPGDTLWDITYRLYGDMSKMQAFVEANQETLSSPSSLSVGMELKVPPLE